MTNSSKTTDSAEAGVIRGGNAHDGMMVMGKYFVECFGADGQLKWSDEFDNLVTDEGKKFLLDQGLAGNTTISSRMMLFSGGTVTAQSTYGGPLVTEVVSGLLASGTSRLTPTWAAATGTTANPMTKGTSAAVVYSITGAGPTVIDGAAIVVAALSTPGALGTPGDQAVTGGRLYSAGYFTAVKTVTAGDVLNVSYVTSLS